jgi:hypothetical protein
MKNEESADSLFVKLFLLEAMSDRCNSICLPRILVIYGKENDSAGDDLEVSIMVAIDHLALAIRHLIQHPRARRHKPEVRARRI